MPHALRLLFAGARCLLPLARSERSPPSANPGTVCQSLGGMRLPATRRPVFAPRCYAAQAACLFAAASRPHIPQKAVVPLDTIRNNTNILPRYALPCRLPALPPPPPPASGLPAARPTGSGLPAGTPPGGKRYQFFRKKYEFSTHFRQTYQQSLNYFHKSIDK